MKYEKSTMSLNSLSMKADALFFRKTVITRSHPKQHLISAYSRVAETESLTDYRKTAVRKESVKI